MEYKSDIVFTLAFSVLLNLSAKNTKINTERNGTDSGIFTLPKKCKFKRTQCSRHQITKTEANFNQRGTFLKHLFLFNIRLL